MANRFIFATSNLSKIKEEKVIKFFDGANAEWWHWLPNTWLIITKVDQNSSDLSKSMTKILPEDYFFFMDVTESRIFSGRFSQNDIERVTDWVRTKWMDNDN